MFSTAIIFFLPSPEFSETQLCITCIVKFNCAGSSARLNESTETPEENNQLCVYVLSQLDVDGFEFRKA